MRTTYQATYKRRYDGKLTICRARRLDDLYRAAAQCSTETYEITFQRVTGTKIEEIV